MADCHNLFQSFNDIITLERPKRDRLRGSRAALREKVRARFRAEGYIVKFHEQGSLAMWTIIEPNGDDYDVDDGTYILQEELPNVSIQTLHRWVVEAAWEHTSLEPQDRGPCVRIFFKAGYHVDLVTYHKREGDTPKLAHKARGWMTSDPKAFLDWFNGCAKGKPQLRCVVRYFKAWSDHLRGEMPPGVIFTILATNHYRSDERDDVAFLETMRSMRDALKIDFACYRPTTPREDLFAGYSETRRRYFLERLDGFIKSGDAAMAEPNQRDACKKWARHFGDRFPCDKAQNQLEDAKVFGAPAFLRTDAKSA